MQKHAEACCLRSVLVGLWTGGQQSESSRTAGPAPLSSKLLVVLYPTTTTTRTKSRPEPGCLKSAKISFLWLSDVTILSVFYSSPKASGLSRTCQLLHLWTFAHAVPSARKILPTASAPLTQVSLTHPTHALARDCFTEEPPGTRQ